MGRVIFHVDMNSFFVSCECAENPELIGKEVAVVPNASSRKSIVLAASYEAKNLGIKTTMHVNEAMRLCKDLIVLVSNFELYEEYSNRFFKYFYSITPLVEPASIDEGYLDVTDVLEKRNISAIDLAIEMQKYIYSYIHLPCSIGIAPNKLLAKMASDMKKPMGITILRKREVPKLMWPLPVGDLIGVGKKTKIELDNLGIKTIGDLANYKKVSDLELILGKNTTQYLIESAYGNGSSVVDVNRINEVHSIGNSSTFDTDEYDIIKIKCMLKILTNSVCERLRSRKLKASTFTVQIKYNNFKTYSKSKTIEDAINDEESVYLITEDLFDDLNTYKLGIRLVGVLSSKLQDSKVDQKQLSIFDSFDKVEKDNAIKKLVNNLNKSLGKDALNIGMKENKDKSE